MRGRARQQRDDCQSPAWWESAYWPAHTHTQKRAAPSSSPSRPLQTTERRRGAWTGKKKKKTLHIFWVAAHYLAPCLQPAAQTEASLEKNRSGSEGQGQNLVGGGGVAFYDITKVFLHIFLWYVDHCVTFWIFDGKQWKWNADYGDLNTFLQMFLMFCGHSRKQIRQFVSSTAPQTNQTKD